MARPKKCKRVCGLPGNDSFGPAGRAQGEMVIMTVEEYETIRLIDWEELTQQQCCQQMEVARTTVQAIYESARKKLADCLVNGKQLQIQGGSYRLCGKECGGCGHKRCWKRTNQKEEL